MEGFPKDIIRYIVLNFLKNKRDIKSFLLCSKKIYNSFTSLERLQFKNRLNARWEIEQHLKKYDHMKDLFCLKCYTQHLNKPSLSFTIFCKNCSASIKKEHIKCRQCSSEGGKLELRPWYRVTNYKLDCHFCKKSFYIKPNWNGEDQCCVNCRILCNKCLKPKPKEMKTFEEKWKENNKGKNRIDYLVFYPPPRNPIYQRPRRYQRVMSLQQRFDYIDYILKHN